MHIGIRAFVRHKSKKENSSQINQIFWFTSYITNIVQQSTLILYICHCIYLLDVCSWSFVFILLRASLGAIVFLLTLLEGKEQFSVTYFYLFIYSSSFIYFYSTADWHIYMRGQSQKSCIVMLNPATFSWTENGMQKFQILDLLSYWVLRKAM